MKPVPVPAPNAPDRLRRLLWQTSWLLLYRPSPIPLHAWRRFLLRCFGARVARGAHPYPAARIWAPWNLVMEQGSCLGQHSDTYNVAQVRLGSRSIVSQKAYLCTASHDVHRSAFPLVAAPISIGSGAWVASAAFVGPGVDIGDGAVVAACAVVTRAVKSYDIVAGNPADIIGRRGTGS